VATLTSTLSAVAIARPAYGWTRRRSLIAIAVASATALAVAFAIDVELMASAGGKLVRTPALLALFLAAYAGAFVLRAVAWSILVPTLGLRHALAILHAALFVNHVAPVKAGEIVRPLLAGRRGVAPLDAIATSIVTRIFDVLSLLAIVVLLMPSAANASAAPQVMTLLLVVGGAIAVAGLAWLRAGSPLFARHPFAERLSQALAKLSLPRLAATGLLTLPSWVLEGAVLFVAASALGAEISVETAIAATAFTLLFQTLHITPGGIGVYEASMTGALVAFGLAPDEALSIAVLAHAMKFAYSFTVGLAFTVNELADTGWAADRLGRRHLTLAVVVLAQLAIVVGYFAADAHTRTIVTLEALLFGGIALAALARQWFGTWRPLPAMPPIATQDARPVVLIIPAHNEAAALPATLARVPHTLVQRTIVVDDGSTDATSAIAASAGVDVVVRHERNRGLGAAVRAGLDAAKAFDPKAVVYIDADGEYDPAELNRLLAPILSGDADYVLGSRYLGQRTGQRTSRRWGNALFTALLGFATGRRITDGQTGYRAFSSRALGAAEIIHDYNYAQVLTLDLLRKRMRMREVPITWRRRTTGTSFVKLDYLWRVPLGMLREIMIT
jgi:uncharacterized membrane protein YbhN (UPF0104 family)